jgi:hypothetical protein
MRDWYDKREAAIGLVLADRTWYNYSIGAERSLIHCDALVAIKIA